jgi:probable phosphoglycerate mutase
METAHPIAARLSVQVTADPMLRERDLGAAQGEPTSSLHPSVSGHDGTVVVDPDARPPGGESLRQLYQRVGRCLDQLRFAPPGPTIVVVTHGGFLRTARAWLSGKSVDAMGWPEEPNGGLWRVDLGDAYRTRLGTTRQPTP